MLIHGSSGGQVAESCRKAGSPEVEVLPFDLSNLSGIKDWAEDLLSKHKEGLDVLVNNAGTLGPLTFDKVLAIFLIPLIANLSCY